MLNGGLAFFLNGTGEGLFFTLRHAAAFSIFCHPEHVALSVCQICNHTRCPRLFTGCLVSTFQLKIPYVESFPTGTPQSPYGKSKLMVEQILTDLQKAQPDWSIALLRYFNPVGAHPSGDMGEDPQGIPNNLMPYIAQVAVGRRESLAVFGNDYPTEDGTGVRDYIHVMDLADGHVAAMEKLADKAGVHIYNLGAGVGSSVLDVVNAFSKACGKPINYHFAPRREGDLPAYWADAEKADRELNWRVTRNLDEMAQDTWHWQSRHPQGYPD